MKGLVKLTARPKLNAPNMLTVWPGVGNVALIVATYLQRKLPFKELGEVEAAYFFDPIGVLVKNNIVEDPQFPRSRFYYWKNKPGASDIILFIGDDQPPAKSYEMAHAVLDIGDRFEVKRVYTCAAAMTRIHHTETPGVLGVATSPEVSTTLAKYELITAANLQIAGMNGLMLGVAKERGFEGVSLLGEVPVYASRIQNPMAALAVLKVLAPMLQIEIDMTELQQLAIEAKERMKQVAAQAMGEYIDFFTEPIWERGEGEEEEGEA